jgi:CRP-like cAMP-binding protein
MVQPSQICADPSIELLARGDFDGATLSHRSEGEILFEANQPAHDVFFVQSGQVRLYHSIESSAERLVNVLGGGSWLGIAAIAAAPSFGMRAQVFDRSMIWTVPATVFLDVLSRTPRLASTVISQMAVSLLNSYHSATRMMAWDCDSRIVQALLDLSTSAAAVPQVDGVSLRITHQELADAVGAARETVTTALKALKREDVLKTKRNCLSFNPKILSQFGQLRSQKSEPEREASKPSE